MDFSKSCSYVEARQEGGVIYKITGEFVKCATLQDLEKNVLQGIRDGYIRVVFDMEEVFYVNSSGIGELLKIYREIKEKKGLFALVNLQEMVETVFNTMNLLDSIPNFKDSETALKELK